MTIWTVEIKTASYFGPFSVCSNRLAYVDGPFEGPAQVVLRDLLTGEETVFRAPRQADQIVIRRYDAAGKVKKLATFQAGGFAGQATVFDDRVSWVNPERKIVVMPLAGGDRIIFRPF